MNQLHLDTLNRISGSPKLCWELVDRIIAASGKLETAWTIVDPAKKDLNHLEIQLEAMAGEFAKEHRKSK